MCTPAGHALMGVAVLSLSGAAIWRRRIIAAFLLLVVANLPDVDIFFGYFTGNPNRYHHMWTHSLAFGVLAGLMAAGLWGWIIKKDAWKAGLLVTGLIFSHLLLDFLTRDGSPPYGMQLFWPFSSAFFIAPVTVFRDVSKASESSVFLKSLFTVYNLQTLAREVALLGPVAAAAAAWQRVRHQKVVCHEPAK
jgi:inner membrane protein